MKKSKIHESSLGGVFMSVTLMMVSHFAQKVRCESSPPVLSTKMKNIVFYIDSLIGFVTGQAIFVLIEVTVFC